MDSTPEGDFHHAPGTLTGQVKCSGLPTGQADVKAFGEIFLTVLLILAFSIFPRSFQYSTTELHCTVRY